MANEKATNLLPTTAGFMPKALVSSGTVTSQVMDMYTKDNPTLQFIWDGTLGGTFDVQTSLDYNPNTGVGEFDSLLLGSTPTAGGSPNHGTIEMNQLGARWLRVVFTWVSGSGNLTGWVMGKGI